MDDLTVEVNGCNGAYYKGVVTDVFDNEVLISFENDWRPEQRFPFDKVRLPGQSAPPENYTEEQEVEVYSIAQPGDAFGWWEAVIVNMYNQSYYRVKYIGWENSDSEIVPIDRLRLKNTSPPITRNTFYNCQIKIPEDLYCRASEEGIHKNFKEAVNASSCRFVPERGVFVLISRHEEAKKTAALIQKGLLEEANSQRQATEQNSEKDLVEVEQARSDPSFTNRNLEASSSNVTKRVDNSSGADKPNQVSGVSVKDASSSNSSDEEYHSASDNEGSNEEKTYGNINVNFVPPGNEAFYFKACEVLSNLAPENSAAVANNFKQLRIDSVAKLRIVTILVYLKGINKPELSAACAEVCAVLDDIHVSGYLTLKNEDGVVYFANFKAILLYVCQQHFKMHLENELNGEEQFQKIQKEKDYDRKEVMEFIWENSQEMNRLMSVKHARFVGELFKRKLIPKDVMTSCAYYLLDMNAKESVDCVRQFLMSICKSPENLTNLWRNDAQLAVLVTLKDCKFDTNCDVAAKVKTDPLERCWACNRVVQSYERVMIGNKVQHRACSSCVRCGQVNSMYLDETGDPICKICVRDAKARSTTKPVTLDKINDVLRATAGNTSTANSLKSLSGGAPDLLINRPSTSSASTKANKPILKPTVIDRSHSAANPSLAHFLTSSTGEVSAPIVHPRTSTPVQPTGIVREENHDNLRALLRALRDQHDSTTAESTVSGISHSSSSAKASTANSRISPSGAIPDPLINRMSYVATKVNQPTFKPAVSHSSAPNPSTTSSSGRVSASATTPVPSSASSVVNNELRAQGSRPPIAVKPAVSGISSSGTNPSTTYSLKSSHIHAPIMHPRIPESAGVSSERKDILKALGSQSASNPPKPPLKPKPSTTGSSGTSKEKYDRGSRRPAPAPPTTSQSSAQASSSSTEVNYLDCEVATDALIFFD